MEDCNDIYLNSTVCRTGTSYWRGKLNHWPLHSNVTHKVFCDELSLSLQLTNISLNFKKSNILIDYISSPASWSLLYPPDLWLLVGWVHDLAFSALQIQ